MQILGLDVHSDHFVVAHLNARGKLCRMYERMTSAETLIDVIGNVRGPKRMVVEESHLAQWVKHTAEAYVDELIICDPKQNRWIAEDEFADDHRSARKLAELLHGGYIKAIRHPDDRGAELRSLFLHYYHLTRETTRFKNMLKGTFRQIAIRAPGQAIYQESERDRWMAKLKAFSHLKHRAGDYFDLLDTLAAKKQKAYQAMVRRARGTVAFKILQTVPGVGPVVAAGYIALIDTPHRFSRKNKLWAYACLGNRYHKSDDIVYENRRSKTGCRPLKWLVLHQFQGAVIRSKTSNRFSRQCDRLIRSGLGRRAARRQVCRTLLSTVRVVWKKGEAYRELPEVPSNTK